MLKMIPLALVMLLAACHPPHGMNGDMSCCCKECCKMMDKSDKGDCPMCAKKKRADTAEHHDSKHKH